MSNETITELLTEEAIAEVKELARHVAGYHDASTDKSQLLYDLIKKKIYIDSIEGGVLNEETMEIEGGTLVTKFHPNIDLLYTEEEQAKILEDIEIIRKYNELDLSELTNVVSRIDKIVKVTTTVEVVE